MNHGDMTSLERALLKETSALKERVAYLETSFGLKGWEPWTWVFGLTKCEAYLFNMLMRRELISNDALIAAWDGEISLDSIKCHACSLRRKLCPWMIHIDTIKHVGYRISTAHKEKANAIRDRGSARLALRGVFDVARPKANGARASS